MADSFSANLAVSLLYGHEAGHLIRSSSRPKHFSPALAGSRRVLDVQEFMMRKEVGPQASWLDSGTHTGSVMSCGDLRKTVLVWPDMPAVSQGAGGLQWLSSVYKDVVKPEPVMLSQHPDIAIKNRAHTRHTVRARACPA
ncbi:MULTISPECIES: hypothetical protein [Pseudomonadota]|jgi:hypothetical protein|uniref:hypothetical protein n=1 Tax=Pseudomonadota TaxID=1224 RepID=UPI0005B49698|nr:MULTISPECIES: hypothetical protein [Pseudomonadota]MBV5648692.1 hypothetical protein [Pseudomonas aeruginosa]MDC3951608.1 hypothetical protein [Pseudomonas aeruginosa]NTS98911.1 hypothetical protein [Pseudomonas aeruginosa]QGL92317.1 hypothetical protein FEO92_07995 [Stenotrophomonas maltophilia]UTM00452.1 hypothetical protein MID00_13195 [Alcaligenes sp. NLF5-7]